MEAKNGWRLLSLSELMPIYANVAVDERTHLTKTCTTLLVKRLNDYSIEDLRIMIGQEFGLEYLVPIAIEKLYEDLFAEGDFYEGDLLNNVLRVPAAFWQKNEILRAELSQLVASRLDEIKKHEVKIDYQNWI